MSEHRPDPLQRDTVLACLGPDAHAIALDVWETCESTNTTLLAASAQPGLMQALAAETQTAGRGRRARSWQSWPGSLTFSVRTDCLAGQSAAGLSLAAGLAVAEALEALGSPPIALKWPNDILLNGAKAGGILVELASRGAQQARVIGVGLNLQTPPLTAPYPVAGVFAHSLQPPARNVVLAQMLRALAAMLQVFDAQGFAPFRARWQARNAFADRDVLIIDDTRTRPGRCRGVDEDGALLLETAQGLERVLSGDVSLRAAA